jgi:plastocyanin domain-containing protein
VQRGIPVKWIIRAKAEDLNECNNAITAPAFGLEAKLAAGDTVLEFTPSATGEFPFTCWMDMIKSTITVVEQGG